MASVQPMLTLYETDFVAWADQMAQLLAQRRFNELDLINLIDEVEDLSGRERQALSSNLKVILLHLLKWQFQWEQRSTSCKASIREHRQRVQRQLKDSPSLAPYLEETLIECYEDARPLALDETGLPDESLPSECPYSTHQLLDQAFWPSSEV
jgi:predicted DNA-binding ribbon-helix-helix protein